MYKYFPLVLKNLFKKIYKIRTRKKERGAEFNNKKFRKKIFKHK